MAESVGGIYYTVEARTGALIEGERQANASLDRLQGGFNSTDKSAQRLDSNLSKLSATIKAVITASVLRDIAAMVQGYQEMEDRIRLATRSADEYRTVQDRLLSTANATYRSLTEAQELYIQTSDAIRSMGYSLNQTLDIQDSLSFAFVKNATSADRADAAIEAMTVALQKGQVEGDGWTTLVSAIPSIVNDVAAATGRTATEVRNLGASGKLAGRDLTEGLRKSLTQSAEAAAGMTNNLRDAGVRVKTALTQIFVSAENQTGALQKLTDGIIKAADMMLQFGLDSDKMSTALDVATTAGLALAAVYTGRLLTSLGSYASAQISALSTTIARNNADRLSAEIAMRKAAAERVVAAEAVKVAAAEFEAARGTNAHTLAANQLTAARERAAVAVTQYTAAQQRMNAIATAGTAVMNGLKGVMAFLGGPAGLVMLAATALLIFAGNANASKTAVDSLNASLDQLTFNQLVRSSNELKDSIQEIGMTDLSKARNEVNTLSKAFWESDSDFKKRSDAARAGLDDVNVSLAERQKRLAEINAELDKRKNKANEPSTGPTGAPAVQDDPDAAKRLTDLRDELALLKLTGAEREKLKAIQALGDKASPAQREEAEKLAASIYALETAEKAKNKAVKEGDTAAKQALKTLKDRLEEARVEAHTAGMTKKETELYKLQLMGATEEQLKTAAASLTVTEAYEAQKKKTEELAAAEKARRAKYGTDVFGTDGQKAKDEITGNVDPLKGGEFDNQYARYEAEAKAEQKRYADQMTRLKEAQDLKIEVIGGYQALEQEMAQTHADRLKQIEEAKNSMILQSGASFFESMASAAQNFAGESSAAYQTLFGIAKAFAIADASLKLSSAIAQAMADPTALTPAQKFANMAAVASAGANVLSQISSVGFSGRANGGPVQNGQMYRINEGGGPEVFNAANGQQFMLPNQRGEVVSTANAGGGGGVINYISIQVGSDGSASVNAGTSSSDSRALANGIKAVVVDEIERQMRPHGLLWKMAEGQS